ncbi:pentatricopeptide repeat domain-containing protein 3 [Paragonimus westermani]|uniref:Pentatricopeptide repeat domain-containing protein 3 n=1 Tax=Paragonimus westermani TaxID=34504 RepID=A0A5J4NKB0_9TREM|nr:pentatricopeptide repeat domain-containing protein 3 [Paragonimus westermani]
MIGSAFTTNTGYSSQSDEYAHSELIFLLPLISSRTEFYNNGRAFSPTAHSPPTVQSVYRYTSPRCELLPDPEAEKSPNVPCLNCPAHDILRLFVNLPRILEGLSMTLCRRAIVSRHLAMFLDYLERTSTYWFTEMCPVEFETKLSVRNVIPTASTALVFLLSEDQLVISSLLKFLIRPIRSCGPPCVYSAARLRCSSSLISQSVSAQPDIHPPLKKYRDHTSVLRSLAACVQPCPDAPDFRLGGDPWLGSTFQSRTFLLARAKGRLAAKMAARDYFPNDVVAIAKELPRMNRFLPLMTPNEVLKRMSDGAFTPTEAMERLILLLAPQHAWKLYHEMAPEEPWSAEMLHSLLDLLCATSCSPLSGTDLSCLPDADEVYFMDELAAFEKHLSDRLPTGKPTRTLEAPEVPGEAEEIDMVTDTADQQLNVTETSTSTFHVRWSLSNHAEQLFNKKREILRTCAGYCSMIRGAAKHRNPERALQLAEEAWNTEAVGSGLDVTTYSLLLRSLHHLNEADLWLIARSIFDRMITFNRVPDMQVFSSFLYSLAESVISWTKRADSPSVIEAQLDNHVAIGLGLLDEIRMLGLEPSLGVMANLLRTIHFAHLPVQRERTDRVSMNRPSYSASELVDSFVSELELRFKRVCPSRWDGWTLDDFSFFPIAMRIASVENNLTLAWKIDNLLVGTSDRRFFLSTSQHKRSYVVAYSLLVINTFWINRDNPLHVIQRVERLYRTYRDVIATTSKTASRIIYVCEKILNLLSDKNASADQMEAKRLAYLCLCDMFSDLTDQFRFTSNLRAQKSILLIAQILAEHASQNPSLAVTTTMNVLTRLKLAAEKSVLDAARRAPESTVIDSSVTQAFKDSEFIRYLIQMNFPAVFQALHEPEHHLEVTSSQHLVIRRLVDTLHEWFTYAVAQGAVLWSWAPVVIGFLWEHDDDLHDELVWDALLQLSTLPYTPACPLEDSRYQSLLNPVLNALEQSISASASGVHLRDRHRELLSVVRRTLQEGASKIPLQPDSSSGSRVTVAG